MQSFPRGFGDRRLLNCLRTCLALVIAGLLPLTATAAGTGQPPNVVIILSDDQAWGDYGFMGHPHIRTPHLDELAAQSVTFTRGYVPMSLCRPSLMTLVTGLYPHQHLVTGNDPPKGTDRNLMLRHVRRLPTLPKLLAEKGYVSFQSGKWWEGSFAEGGFTAGMTHGDVARGGRHGDEGLKIGRQGLAPVLDCISANKSKPFFLWYAPMLPHAPHNPPERLLAKYRNKTDSIHVARYWAMCEWWDETCGELLAHLDREGLADDTLVVYLADNGWIQSPDKPQYAPRSKRSPNEGGIRTPILLRWPARLKPRRDESTLVSSLDIAPTLLAACGLAPTKEMTGINLLPVAGGKPSGRDTLVGEIFEHDIPDIDRAEPGLVFRWCIAGDWKLIESADGKERELYNLKADPREERDLSTSQPQRILELSAKIKSIWQPARIKD